VEDSTSNLVGISFALAEGGFSAPVTTNANLSGSANMALIDVNGDHKPDVIVTNHSASAVQIFRNDCGK